MGSFVVHLLHVGAWIFGIIFVLAIVGAVAIVNWVVSFFRKTEAVVEEGVQDAQSRLHRH